MEISQPHSSSQQPTDPLGELLHALNQPLTQIRCSLELALRRPSSIEDYQETLAAALGQAERASNISFAMQQVLEIKRQKGISPQKTRLSTAAEGVLTDFLPVAASTGINIIRRESADCEVAVSAGVLGTALFLCLDQIFKRAESSDAIQIGTEEHQETAHLFFRLVRTRGIFSTPCEESELLIVKSIFAAFGADLTVHLLGNILEFQVRLPIVTEM